MTNRLLRVRSLLKQEIGSVLEKDFHFENVLVTINDIDITRDLRNAHVYIGMVGGAPADRRIAREKLIDGRVLIQRKVGKRVILKNTPRLHFKLDDSVERGVGLVNLIQEIDELPTAPPAEEEE